MYTMPTANHASPARYQVSWTPDLPGLPETVDTSEALTVCAARRVTAYLLSASHGWVGTVTPDGAARLLKPTRRVH